MQVGKWSASRSGHLTSKKRIPRKPLNMRLGWSQNQPGCSLKASLAHTGIRTQDLPARILVAILIRLTQFCYNNIRGWLQVVTQNDEASVGYSKIECQKCPRVREKFAVRGSNEFELCTAYLM
jgi:hypothetical protein